MKPYFQKIACDTETPVSLYTKLAQPHQYAFLLESAETHSEASCKDEKVGRYSVIGFDPLFLHVFPVGGKKNPLTILKSAYEKIQYTPEPGLPRLQAPFVGYFCYEVARHFETLAIPLDGTDIPEGIFFFPKNLLIFDHFEKSLTLICYSKSDLEKLASGVSAAMKNANLNDAPLLAELGLNKNPGAGIAKSNTRFEKDVLLAKEKICAGEVFQIVISQLFQQKTDTPPFDLYRRMRVLSPSPYMYYLQYPDFSIIGSSPETLVRTEGNEVILRPIAGTRRRGKNPEEDAFMAEELERDTKERAEHMMLVDLGRNDVGKVAKPGSVCVTRLMEVEKYSHVMHLVSEIRGEIAEGKSLFDIFQTSFPAGTLTGAPKISAMEIIAELENCPRGIYGGAVGYFDLSGNMDFAIAIRTMVYKNGAVSLRAGAGIVYDSVPNRENLECFNKASGPLSSLAQ